MGDPVKYRDGLPLEWRVTLFYVTAATILTVIIILAVHSKLSSISGEIDEMRGSIAEHNAGLCPTCDCTL